MRYYNRLEIASLFKVSPATVWLWLKTQKLSKPKLQGRMMLWSEKQLQAFSVLTGREMEVGS